MRALYRQHGSVLVDNHIKLHRYQGILHRFIGGPGSGQQSPVFAALLPDAEHGRPGAAQIIAIGKALSAKDGFQPVHLPPGDPAGVYGLPVDACHCGHIFRPLHPALQLDRRHPHLLQLPQIGGQAVVLQAQGVLVLKPPIAIGQATRLRALPPVAGPAANDARHIALAGIAHTQCPVDEHLNFHRAVPADSGNLLLGQLPGQDHPGNPQRRRLEHPIQTVNGHLGGGVNGDMGRNLAAQGQNPQILDNVCVHLGPGSGPNEFRRLRTLPVRNQGI